MRATRVHELARELGTSSAEIIGLLQSQGFFVRSASSRVEQSGADWLRFEFSSEVTAPPPFERPPPRAKRTTRRPWTDGDWFGVGRPRRSSGEIPGFPDDKSFAHRATSSVPVYGRTREHANGLDLASVEAGLVGSPYSLPDEQAEYLATSFLPRLAALSIKAERESRRVSEVRMATLRRTNRSSEIYQSNRLEGLGPDLATTDKILNRHKLHQRADVSIAHQAIDRCLTEEPKIRDVVGLGAARLLAEIFCADTSRQMTESDVRDLHSLILVGDSRRGKYKEYINSISGSDHVPPTPADTPDQMSQLINWLATTELAPLWRAAVTHAWLTHIHPFHDGNGRIARLLSNLILIRAGIPPLIVRAESDRGAYISALGDSDDGGDILPLARVFRDVLSRSVSDLAQPQLADEVYRADVDAHDGSDHQDWNRLLQEFLDELAPRLLLHRLNLYPIGEVSSASIRLIANGRSENTWLAKVGVGGGARDLLLHAAAPTSQNRVYLKERVTPSIFVSVRSSRPLDARQYLPVGHTGFAYEFTPVAEAQTVVIRRERLSGELPVDRAASEAADNLARTYQQLIGRP